MAVAALDEKSRNVVPRWRDSRITARIAELDSPTTTRSDGGPDEREFQLRLLEWHRAPTILTAAELVNAAIVINRRSDAGDAARYLLSDGRSLSGSLRAIAERIARPSSMAGVPVDTSADAPERQRISAIRQGINIYPRNAIAWVDLSREYASLGQLHQALRAMNVGLSLEPDNRFVVRSAARFFLHVDDPERAHQVLMRARSTPFDPWMVAAESRRRPWRVAHRSFRLRGGSYFRVTTATFTLPNSRAPWLRTNCGPATRRALASCSAARF